MLYIKKQTTKFAILSALLVALTGCAATEESSSGSGSGSASASASSSGSSSYVLKVSVSGLQQGKNVVLSSGQSTATNVFTEYEALGITTDGTYSFGSFTSGTSYNITVRQQPVSQTCTVTSGEGSLSDNTTIAVACSSESYTISGTVVGMLSSESVTLQNNSGDNRTVSDNTSFTFETKVASGLTYVVTVKTQPTGQTCTPNLNSGVVSGNVTDVSIICSYTVYTVSGNVSGLSGTLVLQNNYGSDQTLTSDGSFSFRVASSAKYNVRVKTQPNGKCVVSNGSGTASSDVDNVSVGCWVLVDGGGSSNGVNKNSTYRADNVSLHAFPTANNLFEAAFGNNTFVAVGSSPTANNFSGVTFGNNTFVAVGNSGIIVRSTDNGTSWDNTTSPTANGLYGVTFENNTFVGVGLSGNIIRSTDNGTSWGNTTTYSNSKLYVSWSEMSEVGSFSQIRVKNYDNSSWSTIDGDRNNGINLRGSRNATHPSLADNGTHLFAIWSEDNGEGKGEIHSKVYDNSTDYWDTNSNFQALNYSTSYSANDPQLLYNNSSLYAIWSENNGTANQVRVKQFDNSSSWNLVDNTGAPTTGINKNIVRNAINPKMQNFKTEIYAAWSEDNGSASQIRVAKFDNSSSWSFVDDNSSTGINMATGKNATDPAMAVLSTKLYIAWSETNADNRTQIRVKSYDGNSWSFVDGDNATKGINKDYTQNASYPQLVKVTEGNIVRSTDYGTSWNNATFNSSSSKLYAVWLEENGNTQVRVTEFDGTSTWSFKDGNSFDGLNLNTAKITGKPSAAAYLNKLIVAWSETNSLGVPQIRVAKSPF